MAAIRLMTKIPREAEISIDELSWAKDMIPASGGEAQRQDRLGTRHAINVSIPALAAEACGLELGVDLALGRTGDGALMPIPEALPIVPYGLPSVTTAGQLGSQIELKGIPIGTVLRKGKWLNLTANGRIFAYYVRANTTVTGANVIVPIYPMIRRSPASNSTVELSAPVIQGLVKEPVTRRFIRRRAMSYDFRIEEAA